MLGPRETRPGDVAVVFKTLPPGGSTPRGIADNLELATQAVKEPAIVDLGPKARALADRKDRGARFGPTEPEPRNDKPATLGLPSTEETDETRGQPFREYPLYGLANESKAAERSYAPPNDLTEEEQQELEQLKKQDREVRAHEQAHKAIAGQYAGPITYELERGPDGRSYAVGGEVPIDLAPVAGDPNATIAKMERLRSAAIGPTAPSGADHQVAARASQEAQRARLELARQRYGGSEDSNHSPTTERPADIDGTELASRAPVSVDVLA
jgi:hypothetical protein